MEAFTRLNALVITIVILTACGVIIGRSNAQCLSTSSANDIGLTNESSVGAAVRTLIDGSLGFSLNMMRTLEYQNRWNKNSVGLFFSPYSIWSALMLTFLGAKGRTELELRNVLGTGNWNKDTAWEAYRNIRIWNAFRQQQQLIQQGRANQDSTPADDSYQIANRLYFQQGTPIRECIRDMMGSEEIDFTDFVSDPEGSVEAINKWVSDQTQNRIQQLVPSGSAGPMTKMIIANAVYFKESWQVQFDPNKTRRARFTLSNRKDINVKMMNLKGRFLYGISEELQCTGLELPYKGNDLNMLILLPNNRYYGVSILANRLTPERLQDFLADMYPREVLVSLPKFTMDDNFELSPTLAKMGVRTLFDQRQSDLTDFTGSKDDKISVDAVHHKSFVDVNEEGTEAAAATAVIASRTARPIGPAAFIADYPFIFMIRDNVANLVLFMGSVQKPPEYTP